MKFKQVIFKGLAPCGYNGYGKVEDVAEKRWQHFIDTGYYDIKVVGEIEWKGNHNEFPPSENKSNKPTNENTVDEIKTWLTANKIEFTGTHNTKAKLLTLVP